DYHQADGDEHEAATLVVATAAGHHAVAPAAQHEVTDHADDQDAVEPADEADVQAHVTVEDVAEFVGNHALQLVTVEQLDAAARDADDGVFLAVTGREGVDRRILEQVDRRHRQAAGDGHFLHHVEDLALVGVARVEVQQASTERLGHHLATATQLRHAEHA